MKYLIFIISFFSVFASNAQQPFAISINVEQNLPSPYIFDVLEDNSGYIWVASNDGLSKYDGFEFINYKTKTSASLSGSNICQDKFGKIWYQTFDGQIFFVENDTLQLFSAKKSIGYHPFGIVDTVLWQINKDGLTAYNILSHQEIKRFPFNFYALKYSAVDSDNFYMLISDTLVSVNNNFQINYLKLPQEIFDNFTYVFSSNDKLFLAQKFNETEVLYEIINGKCLPILSLPNIDFIQNVVYINQEIWILTNNGIHRFNYKTKQVINKPLFEGISFSKVIVDFQKNYWLASNKNGIFIVTDIEKIEFDLSNISPHRIAILENEILLSNSKGEIYKTDFSINKTNKIVEKRNQTEFFSMQFDAKKRKIIALSNISYFFDTKNKSVDEFKLNIKEIVTLDEKYYAVAGTSSSGLLQLDEDKNKSSIWDSVFLAFRNNEVNNNASLLPFQRGKSVKFIEGNNTIYFVTNEGLFAVTPSFKIELNFNNAPIAADKLLNFENKLFIINVNNEILLLENDNIKVVFTSNEKIKLAKIFDNYLFYSVGYNFYKVNVANEKFMPEKILLGLNANTIQDYIYKDEKLFLLLKDKMVTYNLLQQNVVVKKPKFILHSIKSNNIEVDLKTSKKLPYNENNIEIKYSILNYSNQNTDLYYKLNNNNWELLPNNSRALSFLRLEPAKYSISFSFNEDGNQILETVDFQINAPFYKKWWFFGLVFLLLSSIFGTFYFIRVSNLKKQNTLLKEKVKLEKMLTKSTLTSIKAQLNPHFFYNALNTIQAYIFSNDKRNASNYLNKFSDLTRLILDMSDKESVTLRHELEALELYLELEKMRFSNDFTFEINKQNTIDLDFVKIPSMLIQPYVENALKHGLLNSNINKKLLINFELEKDILFVKIEDNGIGRKKATEIKNNKHQSFSTGANLKRLEIINKDNLNLVSVEYVDKYSSTNQPEGTLVILRIVVK